MPSPTKQTTARPWGRKVGEKKKKRGDRGRVDIKEERGERNCQLNDRVAERVKSD